MADWLRFEADLEREAVTAIWREKLSAIPSTFARLLYLASLRGDPDGRYSESALIARFGEVETDFALRVCHEMVFAQWLGYALEQQKTEVELYLSALRDNRRAILRTWLRLDAYRGLLPEAADDEERRLYLCDIEAVLDLLRAQFEQGRDGTEGASIN
jgi:hypothetical protein